MRLREMRKGQRERSVNWRADYLETRTVGSEEGGGKRAARAVPRQPPILLGPSVARTEENGSKCVAGRDFSLGRILIELVSSGSHAEQEARLHTQHGSCGFLPHSPLD